MEAAAGGLSSEAFEGVEGQLRKATKKLAGPARRQ